MSAVGLHLDATPPYVRGAYDFAYDVSRGVAQVDEHLTRLHDQRARVDHPDIDLLLEARSVLAARERAAETKEASA